MKSCVVFLIVGVVFVAYLMHTPLPQNLTALETMQFVEPFMRLLFYYPNNALNYFGLYRLRVYWSRLVIASFARLEKFCTTVGRPLIGISQIEDIKISDVPVRIYTPSKKFNEGVVFFMHGGGYVLFSVEVYDALTRLIAVETGMTVLSVEYRLAPEHPYPAALHDCEKVLLGLMTKDYKTWNIDRSKIILAGDSAGGSLAAILSRKFKDDPRLLNLPPLKAQVLIYPLTQFVDLQTPSYQHGKFATEGTSLLDAESLALWMLLYLGIDPSNVPYIVNNGHWQADNFNQRFMDYLEHVDHSHLPFDKNADFYKKIDFSMEKSSFLINHDLSTKMEKLLFDPDFSPLMAERGALKGSPDTLIITCEFDLLRDDGYFYHRRLQNEGVKSKWIHYDQGFHGMLNMHVLLQLAQQAVKEIALFINTTLSQ